MKGEQYLTRTAQFEVVYKKGSSWAHPLLVMKTLPNGLEYSRFGFSVSRRVGNAVTRNRIKRLLREILRTACLKPGWDIVCIARPPVATQSYSVIAPVTKSLLMRAGVLSKDYEKTCSGAN